MHGFTYNGETYLYVKNLQGDVECVISAADNLLCVGYIYDPWGNVYAITDEEADATELAIAEGIIAINNITYRGYFYDSDTGFYYLQSRYYDPEIGRFINADDTKYIGYDDIPISVNIFSYCCNNTLTNSDPRGSWPVKYKNYIFVYDKPGSDFIDQAEWMANYAYDGKNVSYIEVDKIYEFCNAWNKLKNKYIKDIHLFFHGGKDVLYFNNESMKGSSIENLSKLNITGKVYLYSCHGGTKKNYNCIAWRFAKIINKKAVRAVVNGSVYYRDWYQLFSYKPLTKEKGAYWADFKYTKYKGKMQLTENSIGRKWCL